jgi:hypothetical protein
MGPMMRMAFGWLLLLALAGCSASAPTGTKPASAPTADSREDCERSGGIWRADRAYCERPGGAGGGY